MTQTTSIIVEWENVLLAEDERCIEMLERLRGQIIESTMPIEVLIVFNPEQVAGAIIEDAISKYLNPSAHADGRRINCRILPGPGLHYYDLKNFGVQQSQGDIVVFIDSDVIPEEKWLQNLLAPFQQFEGIQVVAGQTHIDANNLMAKAFSLGWFFPLREPTGKVTRNARGFFANNVAFRRDTFARYPFPQMPPGITRGACVTLAESLTEAGIEILRTSSACCSHPPPNGWQHFFDRSLADGRDQASRQLVSGHSKPRVAFALFRRQISRIRKSAKKIVRHRATVGLSWVETPLAVVLMTIFHVIGIFGAWIYLAFPVFAERQWRI